MCDSNFWLELNYLEVAKAAQSCSAHFTALLYTEIYVDKLKADLEEAHRCAASLFSWLHAINALSPALALQVHVESSAQADF